MDGIVTILKTPGMTSSNVVFDVRKIFCEKRAGHLGTLDPAAAGVLPVCLGRATRLFDILVDKDKEYVFECVFGTQTDTQDAYGVVIARDDKRITKDELEQVLPKFVGEQMQTASIYSALKVDGKKMYDLARAGQTIEPKVREICVHELELVEQTGENRFLLRAHCSRGTYVRSLCESIAQRLGTVAYVSVLLRTKSGPFVSEQAYTIAELDAAKEAGTVMEKLISCEEAMAFLPEHRLPLDRLTPTKNGLETHLRGMQDGLVRAYAQEQFLGIGEIRSERFRLTIHLY
ncbi:MAG: tRNA pseudouridine(55) synthase TruB [Firmicutes bacterium HGW-Firmicutes-9]|jgi:tRNA pseudouridine55 synthase|nr:MAG: tRNA pseudouridine(55) synthase TruB [Firmicutes bacterium HGW-Firmicutes-9]